MSCFTFFLNLIYLPGHILDKKEMGAILKQKDSKRLQKLRLSVVFKDKGCNCHM